MVARGQQLQGVRIDSGDLAKLAAEVRKIFDEAGLKNVKIIGSGGLDEYDLGRAIQTPKFLTTATVWEPKWASPPMLLGQI